MPPYLLCFLLRKNVNQEFLEAIDTSCISDAKESWQCYLVIARVFRNPTRAKTEPAWQKFPASAGEATLGTCTAFPARPRKCQGPALFPSNPAPENQWANGRDPRGGLGRRGDSREEAAKAALLA